MIVCHEGLPGAGKSYEAVLSFVLPALKEGREVYTNIRGLDHVAIAAHLSIAPVFLVGKIHATSPDPEPGEDSGKGQHLERQKRFFLSAGSNCLILWDEVQDFFPKGKAELPAVWSEFIAAHRHMARDIVLMTQDLRDCHPMWRRRVEQLIRFRKLSIFGGKGYRWEIFQNKGGDKWESMQTGTRKYDKRIFALYMSIRASSDQGHKLLTHDKNPLSQSWFLRFGLPAFALALVWASFTLYDIFAGDAFVPEKPPEPVKQEAQKFSPVVPVQPPTSEQLVAAAAEPEAVKKGGPVTLAKDPVDFLADHLGKSRAFVTGMIVKPSTGEWFADVEFFDSQSASVPYMRLDRSGIQALSRSAEAHPAGLKVTLFDGSVRLIMFKVGADMPGTTGVSLQAYRAKAFTDAP